MRIRSLSATVLAAAATFRGAACQAAGSDSIKAADVVQDGAAPAITTSAQTTFYLTMTVERVVETVTATRNYTAPLTTSTPLASASMSITAYANGTASVFGTGAGPSSSATQTPEPLTPANAAGRLDMDTVGLAAIAGFVGLLVA